MNTDNLRVAFDKAKRERLRKEYKKALKEGKEVFKFEGHDYVLRYAMYLLEYLDRKL